MTAKHTHKDETVAEKLKRAGYGYRKNNRSAVTGAMEIYSLTTGEIAGYMVAHVASEFADKQLKAEGRQP